MRTKAISFFLIASIVAIIVGEINIPIVIASNGSSSLLMENVNVNVNCTTARLYINCMVSSNDSSLVHFPPEVDMYRTELTDAVSISLMFSRVLSALIFTFNNTDEATARTLADAVKGSVETAFDTSFTFNSTGTHDSYTNVTYTGLGKTDLTGYMD